MEAGKLKLHTRNMELSFRIFDVLLESEGTILYLIKQGSVVSWISEQSMKQRINTAESESRVMSVEIAENAEYKDYRPLPEIPENKKSKGFLSAKMESFYLQAQQHSEEKAFNRGFSFGSPHDFQ